MHAATLARRTSFSDFSEGSGRRQCTCIARSTGERCRRDAVGGVASCPSHRGLAHAVTKAKRDPRVVRLVNASAVRRALAVAGFAAVAAGETSEPGEGIVAIGRKWLTCQTI
jgi:hypothetical protein